MDSILKKIKGVSAISMENVITRFIASWLLIIAYNLEKESETKFTQLAYGQETKLSKLILSIFALFLLFTVVKMLLKEAESDSWFMMVGATVCTVLWITEFTNTNTAFFFSVGIVAAYSLFTVYFVRKNEELWKKWMPGGLTVWTCSIIMGIICCAGISYVTCLRYITYASPNFDFGLFVNMFHNMKETGLPLVSSERDVLMSHFAVHFSPIYYLVLPFYFIFPNPLTIQIAQAVALASGVIPVVLLCKKLGVSGKATMIASLLYSLYPAITTGCYYDFHENCFLTPLLLWTFYFFEKRSYIPAYIFAILTCTVKEDAAIYVIIFALYLFFSKKDRIHGIILAVFAFAYFSLAIDFLEDASKFYMEKYASDTPNPGIAGPMFDRYKNLTLKPEDGLKGVIYTAIVNPGFLLTQIFTTSSTDYNKVVYLVRMLLPLGFLPLCTKKASRWILIAPILLNLLTNYIYQYDTGFHYSFGISAFLVYAAILNIKDLKAPTRKGLLSFASAACCVLYLCMTFPTVSSYNSRYLNDKQTYKQMDEILETIPEDAVISVDTFLLAHVADRKEVYQIKYHGTEDDVEYVVFDGRYAIDQKVLNDYLNKGYYIHEEHKGLITILKKGEAPVK